MTHKKERDLPGNVDTTVEESNVFRALGIALSENQIPRSVGNVSSWEQEKEPLE
jgi:hypothetical protein